MSFYLSAALASLPVTDDLCPEEGNRLTQSHRHAFREHGIHFPSVYLDPALHFSASACASVRLLFFTSHVDLLCDIHKCFSCFSSNSISKARAPLLRWRPESHFVFSAWHWTIFNEETVLKEKVSKCQPFIFDKERVFLASKVEFLCRCKYHVRIMPSLLCY